MSDQKQEEKTEVKLVYIGRRWDYRKSKPINMFMGLEDENDTRSYDKFKPHGCNVGTVFTVEQNKERQVYVNSAKNFCRFEDVARVAQWEIEDEAAYHRQTEKRLVTRLNKNSAFTELVEPVKNVYHRLSFAERESFILALIRELKS